MWYPYLLPDMVRYLTCSSRITSAIGARQIDFLESHFFLSMPHTTSYNHIQQTTNWNKSSP